MCLVVPLFLSMTAVAVNAMTVYPPAPWKIWVIPSSVNGTEVGVGNNFDLTVNITGGDIYGIDWRLSWNDTLLEFVSKVSYIPGKNATGDVEGAWAEGQQMLADRAENKTGGIAGVKNTYHWAYLTLGAGPPFNGTLTLAKVTLKVLSSAVYANCTLDLHRLSVVGYLLGPDITGEFTVEDGSYVIPEFPVSLIMPLFIVLTLVAVVLGKAALSRKRRASLLSGRTLLSPAA